MSENFVTRKIDNLKIKDDLDVKDKLSVGGNATLSGSCDIVGQLKAPVMKAPVENGDAALNITEALHAGTIVMQVDVSSDRTYTIPQPSAAGVTYRFVGQGKGDAADGHDIILSCKDDTNGVHFDGMVTFLDTSDAACSDPTVTSNSKEDVQTAIAAVTASSVVSGVWANGTNHDQLQINLPQGYDITLVAKNTTTYYVFGTVTSAVAPAFTDS